MSVQPGVNVEDTEQRRLLFIDLIAELPNEEIRKTTLEELEQYINDAIEQCDQFERHIDESEFDEDELDMANDRISELEDEIKELKGKLEKSQQNNS